jgi:hypothetical protein
MTLTTTPTELEQYADKVAQWYSDCMTYILQNFDPQRAPEVRVGDHVRALRQQYEKNNPRPSWKTLL